MRKKSNSLLAAVVVSLLLSVPRVQAQTAPASIPNAEGKATQAAPAATASASSTEPVATFKATSRLVTVEVVAKDHHRQPVKGLTADDFQIFEQEPGWRKEKRPQKIALVRAINISDTASQDRKSLDFPSGIYTNLVTMQKNPVPPTIMLVDALNTPWADRAQVRVQMVRMLRTIPDDVPVAVFLLGRQLRLLQNFTGDPKLLKAALEKSTTVQAGNIAEIDPRDDPDSLSAILEDMPGAQVDAIERFEQETFAAAMDTRERVNTRCIEIIGPACRGLSGQKEPALDFFLIPNRAQS